MFVPEGLDFSVRIIMIFQSPKTSITSYAALQLIELNFNLNYNENDLPIITRSQIRLVNIELMRWPIGAQMNEYYSDIIYGLFDHSTQKWSNYYINALTIRFQRIYSHKGSYSITVITIWKHKKNYHTFVWKGPWELFAEGGNVV